MTRYMAIQRHFARTAIEIRGERLTKERSRRRTSAVTAKEKVDRRFLRVGRPIEVMPFASDGEVRLVGAPESTDGPSEPVPALLMFRHVPGYPSEDCAVGHRDPALRHHCNEVPIAQPIRGVPASA
jgi:hypothetical protein